MTEMMMIIKFIIVAAVDADRHQLYTLSLKRQLLLLMNLMTVTTMTITTTLMVLFWLCYFATKSTTIWFTFSLSLSICFFYSYAIPILRTDPVVTGWPSTWKTDAENISIRSHVDLTNSKTGWTVPLIIKLCREVQLTDWIAKRKYGHFQYPFLRV